MRAPAGSVGARGTNTQMLSCARKPCWSRGQRSDVSSQLWKTGAKYCPDVVLDLVRVARAVDQHDAIWFARCQVAISSPNTLIKLSRFLFHSIRPARLLLHSRFRCGGVDIEDESDIRNAVADHNCIQALDHFAIQSSRR